MTVDPLYFRSDAFHGLKQCIDVPYIREVLYIYSFVSHVRSGQNRKGSILRPSDLYFAIQGYSALNHILFHDNNTSIAFVPIIFYVKVAPKRRFLFAVFL